uniref:RING-type domain-containing protein n=1 Tax=Macrostomum lignano TaxID=282301 RepID=A0A1I8I0J4_9PLAT
QQKQQPVPVETVAEPTTLAKRASSVSTLQPVRPSSGHSKTSSSGGGGSIGGMTEEIEVVFLEELNKKYECPVCSQVLRYPVQFDECGHRCCSSCLPELLRVAPRCPLDQMPIDKDKVYADKAFQVETDNLGVKCSFYGRGCKWTGVLKEL